MQNLHNNIVLNPVTHWNIFVVDKSNGKATVFYYESPDFEWKLGFLDCDNIVNIEGKTKSTDRPKSLSFSYDYTKNNHVSKPPIIPSIDRGFICTSMVILTMLICTAIIMLYLVSP